MTDAQTIAKALVEARKRAAPVKAFPGDIPSTLKAAYAVQHAGVTLRDEKVIGFKVGGIPESWRDQYKSSWMAGPVFLSEFHKVEAGGTLDVPVFKEGFAAYEPELVMVLEGLDKLEASIDTIEEALTYVSDVHIGAEIASSPRANVNELGPGSIISDFGTQGGLVLGPVVGKEVLSQFSELRVTLDIDGERIGDAHPKAGEGGPLGALRFLLNHLREYGQHYDLTGTVYFTSGAITGVHQSHVGTSCDINYEGLGAFTLNMTARPIQTPELEHVS